MDLLPEERLSAFGCYINPEDIVRLLQCAGVQTEFLHSYRQVASSDDLEARFAALQAAHLSSDTLSDLDMKTP